MRVIDVLRICHSPGGWVIFGDMDQKDPRKVFSKPMKIKNITWDRLRHIEYKNVVSVNYSPKDGCMIIRYKIKGSVYDE